MSLKDQLQEHLGDAFVIERELGGGGMSRVFVATETRLNRRVAIKVLSPELAQGLNAERFEREILMAASLQQANIVPVLAAGEVDGLPYFTMPFIDGESLRDRIGNAGLPIIEVVAILRDVSRALAFAHAHGVVHRDIKPDNVLLSGNTAVVTDFGIAKALAESQQQGASGAATLTQMGTSIGTPAYMAPEQVVGDPNIDHRVDLYALGCMAYELLSGKSPFGSETAQRQLAAHLSLQPTPIRELRGDCPPVLAALVTRLLEKDPVDRPAAATDVLARLDAVTTSGSALSLDAPGMLLKALVFYAVAFIAVWILSRAAVVGIGLPDWTVPGAMLVMLLGLPALLFTAYVKRVARKAAGAVPTLTPGGSSALRPAAGTVATIALKANQHLTWRRTARGGMLAMAAFVVLVAGFMITRSLGIGPAASLFATGRLASSDKVVLADLQASAADSSLAAIVVEAVREALSQSRAVTLLAPTDIAQILGEMRRPRNSQLDVATAHDVAIRGGAKAILGGRFARAGNGYAISLALTAANDGEILAAVQGTSSEGDLIKTTDELTRKLRGKIGESLRAVQQSVPLERATTSNLAALRKYTEAVRANDIDQDYDAAVRLAREAVTLDTTFALAWRKLAVAMKNAKMSFASQESALEQAARYSDRLPPLERNLVLGMFRETPGQRLDYAKALEAYRAAYAADSTDPTAVNGIYRLTSDSMESLHFAEIQYRLRPSLNHRLAVTGRRLDVGDTVAAIATLDSIAVANPADTARPSYLRIALRLKIGNEDWGAATTILKQIVALPSIPDRIWALETLATIEQLNGRFAAARKHQDEWGRLIAARGGLDYGPLWEADRDIRFRGKNAEAVRAIQAVVNGKEWTTAQPVDRYYTDVVDMYARAGRPDLAREMLATWKHDAPEMFAPTSPFASFVGIAEAAVLGADGKYPEAVAKLRAAMIDPDGVPASYQASILLALGSAFDRMGQTDSVVTVYHRFLALGPNEQLYGDAAANGLAVIHKRLGEIAESRGDRAEAIAQYQAFVDQWQHADAELQPTVAEVRGRLQALATSDK